MAVNRNYILDKMKGRILNQGEFDFDRLTAPPLYSLLSVEDVNQLHKLATSIRYQAKPIERLQMIDDILKRRGFVKFAGGTNRVVYRFIENDSFLLKVASDAVGVSDNPREFANQMVFKPFVSKVFEVSPCGTVALVERVIPITSREEFLSVADDVFEVVTKWFLGEYVIDDIGSKYFLNFGIRNQFGVVLLDYPYCYKLDGNKLYCNEVMPDGNVCGGVIDYDDGFNHLYCTKCGKMYKAIELKKAIDNGVVVNKGGHSKMKVRCSYGENKETGIVNDSQAYMDIKPRFVPKRRGKKSSIGTLKVEVSRGRRVINETSPKEEEKIRYDEEHKSTLNVRGTVTYAKNTEPVADIVVEAEDIVPAKEYETPKAEVYYDTEGPELIAKDNSVSLINEEPIPATTTTTTSVDDTDEEDDIEEELPLYYSYDAKVISSMDIDGVEEDRFKCYVLVDDNGQPLRIGSEDGPQILVESIEGNPVGDLSIIKKDAYLKLTEAITGAKEKSKELTKKNKELEAKLEALMKENEDLKERLKEDQGDNVVAMTEELQAMAEENNDLQREVNHLKSNIKIMEEDLPYYIDPAGRKRKKGSGAFYGNGKKELHETNKESETSEQTEPDTSEFKIKSPLLEESDEEESVPVGATPPTNKEIKQSKTRKRSERYNEDYYKVPKKK